MSQAILKMANGNKTPEQEPLVYWGSRKYKYSDLEDQLTSNATKYLDSLNLSDSDRETVRGYLNSYLDAFKTGKAKRRVDGTYDITDSSLATDSNTVKRGIFGKVKGDLKRLALGFYNNAFDNMIQHYDKPKDEPKEKPKDKPKPFTYNYNNFLERNIFKDNNKSNTEADIWFSSQDRWSPALKALTDYRNSLTGEYDFVNTPFKDKEDYLNKLLAVESALTNKDSNALKQALYDVGEADTYKYFMDKDSYIKSQLTPEQQIAYDAQKKQEQVKLNMEDLASKEAAAKLANLSHIVVNKDSNIFGMPTNNIGNPTPDNVPLDELPEGFFESYNPNDVGKFSTILGKYLSNDANIQNGYIKNSITTRHGFPTIWKFDKDKGVATEIPLKDVPEAKKIYEKWLADTYKAEGGILKAAKGLDLNVEFNKLFDKPEAKPSHTESKVDFASNPIKPQEYNLTASDYARLAGIGLDVASLISSFFPGYGTIGSAVTGVGSTLVNFGADLADDNVGIGKTFANLGLGLTADAAGLVPALGTATKAGKISKSLVKYAPYLIASVQAINHQGESIGIINSLTKLLNGKELDYNDYLNTAEAIRLVTGLSKAKVNNRKIKNFKRDHVTQSTKYEYTDKGNKVVMSEAEYNKLETKPEAKKIELFDIDRRKRDSSGNLITNPNNPEQFAEYKKGTDNYLFEVLGSKKIPFSQGTSRTSRTTPGWGYQWKKDGGVIYAEEGTKVRNTIAKSGYNRESNFLLNDATLNYLRSINADNYQDFNKYEDLYDSNYENTYGKGSLGTWGTHTLDNLNWNSGTKEMQNTWNTRGLNDILYPWFEARGNTGDRPDTGEDGYFGNITNQRTLGRGLTTAVINKYNEILREKGLKLARQIHGGYRIEKLGVGDLKLTPPKISNGIFSLNGNKPNSLVNDKIEAISNGQGQNTLNDKFKAPEITPSVLSGLRYGIDAIFNNNIKYKPNTLVTDAPTLNAKVHYNLPIENYYNAAANNIRRLGRASATNDAVRNFAQNLEAETKANDYILKGKLANYDAYTKSLENAQNVANTNISAYIQNANKNRARAIATQESKAAFERAKNLKQMQNLNNLLFEWQQNQQARNAKLYALDEDALNDKLSVEYQNYQTTAKNNLNEIANLYGTDSNQYRDALAKYNKDMTKYVMDSRNAKRESAKKYLTYFKSGGTLKDASEYNKTLRSNQQELNKLIKLSITEGNKAINGLSKYSADLIKLSLKL